MRGTILSLPAGSKQGRIRNDDNSRGGALRLDQRDVDAAPEGLDLKVKGKVAFDTVMRGGLICAVNLHDPAADSIAPPEPDPQQPESPPKPDSIPDEQAGAERTGEQRQMPPAQPRATESQGGSNDQPSPPQPPVQRGDNDPPPPQPPAAATVAARACNRHTPPTTFPGTRNNTPAPYTFVPIHTENNAVGAELDEFMPHDGASEQARLSGELRIEIEALTPLLAGQHRYDWGKLRAADGGQLLEPSSFRPAKKILEPALVDLGKGRPATVPPARAIAPEVWANYRVLIPATGIKGPIRQAIGAILNAPMERVAERYLSYRPNVDTSTVDQPRYKCFAAVVQEVDTANDMVKVRMLRELNRVLFVENPRTNPQRLSSTQIGWERIPGERPVMVHRQSVLESGNPIDDYDRAQGRDNQGRLRDLNRLEYRTGESWPADRNYLICHYACGIDGNFRMAKRAREQHERNGENDGGEMTARHYFRALVPSAPNQWFPSTSTIGTDLLQQHRALLRELADDKAGHFSRLPRSFWGENLREDDTNRAKKGMGEAIAKNLPRPFQLIYLEAEIDAQQNPTKVVSFGTHFRYRWRYANSVREVNIDPTTDRGTVRPELRPAAEEGIHTSSGDGDIQGKLSGARLLFGYVADKDTATDGIGEESLSRLAGRIAINHALEVVEPESWQPEQRFLRFEGGVQGDARFLLPLRILGAPKPSAVEHYVQQHGIEELPGATVTYGDLPGDPGGVLNGRKFYRHQPMNLGNGTLQGNEPFLAEDEKTCRSDQATLARLVNRPGTRYRYSLRFRDLRPWELGALLVAIQPGLLGELADDDLPHAIRDLIRPARLARNQGNADLLFAAKMGYGRPLGLGSVGMTVDAARLLGDAPKLVAVSGLARWTQEMVTAFLARIEGRETGLANWLTASRYAGQRAADYPRDQEGKIFGYHTKIRTRHAKERRSSVAQPATPSPDRRVWPGNRRPAS